ncbi:MAG: hypothetical protein HY961_21185 [Ignavibacteriae bacterium]|nr:hypothetical protein [Ignavibacteriota bacterium]
MLLIASLLLFIAGATLNAQTDTMTTTWILDRIDSLGGRATSALPDWPSLVETPHGRSASFDGVNDAFLLQCNPLGSANSFTIEVFFRPDTAGGNEQRFIHIRNSANDNRRVLLETRLLPDRRWVFDTFIRSDISSLTLIDSTRRFSGATWHHVALTFANDTMRQYVDGAELLAGRVLYQPIDINGRISIGARQDPRSWFRGLIRMIRISRRALAPAEFYIPTTSVDEERQSKPQGFKLHQNFPNPFNPTTNIFYTLTPFSLLPQGEWVGEPPRSGVRVTLKIYDLLGREVATLLDRAEEPGEHSLVFNAANLSTGAYCYRLQMGQYAETKKMMLVR